MATIYLATAKRVNAAEAKAWKAYQRSDGGLKADRALGKAWAAAELAFTRSLQATPWTGDAAGIARRLITCNSQTYIYDREASLAKTTADALAALNRDTAQSEKCSAISNEMRIYLGLPPI